MQMVYIIDRFEGEYAICEDEDRNMVSVKRHDLPDDAREGDVIVYDGENFTIDRDEASRRKERIKRKMASLWREE